MLSPEIWRGPGYGEDRDTVRIWIRNPLAILAGDEATGGIVVEGDRIAECLVAGAAPAAPCDHTFDASGHVVLPGLINTHHHFYQTLTRACRPALGKELFDWLKALYPIWAGLTPDQPRRCVAARAGRAAALRMHGRGGPPLRLPARARRRPWTSRSRPPGTWGCG